jgi:uncharacterized membrane protein (UPF0127 family)
MAGFLLSQFDCSCLNGRQAAQCCHVAAKQELLMQLRPYLMFITLSLPLWSCQADVRFDLIPLTVGQQQLEVQLADTSEKRMRGLMFQQPVLNGMLLLYEQPQEMVLWMKNTPTALDVAFIDENWTITKISPMQANSETLHSSGGLVIAGLEMPQGWFAANNIAPGTKVESCVHIPQSCSKH